jgi:hypothetical protein
VPDIDPWERQPGETSKAYAAFCVYRDLGQARSLRTTAEALSRSEALLKGWSSKWNWPERSRAWDSIPSKAVAEAHADMARRIAAQHERVATKLMAKLERNTELLPEGADPSMRFSTALGAARQSHQFASDLTRPESTAKDAIAKAIEDLVNKLAGE